MLKELSEDFGVVNLEALMHAERLEPAEFPGPDYRPKDSQNLQVVCSVCGARYRVREKVSTPEAVVKSHCGSHIVYHLGRYPSLWVRPVKMLYGKT